MINTERLRIRIASDAEMRVLIAAEPTEEMKAANGEMLDGALKHPDGRQWYAIWFICLKSGEKIGDLCFKGVSPEGSTEIGYGILPPFRGRGYACEAADAAVSWALMQEGIETVKAETDAGNIASRRVLEKIGFRATGQTGEEGPRFVYGGDSGMQGKLILETDRLILRRYCDNDFDDLFEYLSDEEVVRFEPYKPMNGDAVKETLKWRISSDEMIAVELKSTGKMIGNIYLGKRAFETREIGYVFNRAYWGMGYAKEGCKAVIDDCFKNGIHRIFAECDPENANSWRLLEALGFEREAHLKQNDYFWKDECGRPIWKDTFIYSLLNKQ